MAVEEVGVESDRRKCASWCTKVNAQNFTKIAPAAWIILLGDSIHNFMDGMAIAVAFNKSSLMGLSITLCILFEELPHELGKFNGYIHPP